MIALFVALSLIILIVAALSAYSREDRAELQEFIARNFKNIK